LGEVQLPETPMRAHVFAAALSLALAGNAVAALPGFGAGLDTQVMAMDRPLTIGGIHAACTGVGQTRADPQWLTYSIRLEFSNARAEYLSGEEVVIYDDANRPILSLACEDPWLLLDLPPGTYLVEARIQGEADLGIRRVAVHPTARGQQRVVIQFPDAN
jgi:hypothetical protein